VQRWLRIASCATLFNEDAGRVQVTSVLRHAVFVNGKNYSGTPAMTRTPFLQQQILEWFAPEAAQLRQAIFVPMGSTVGEALDWLATRGVIDKARILHGLPHPSGANAERVAYFLGRKDKATLSANTNGEQIDATRAALMALMETLIASGA
jgi:hypothetical protein